MNSLLFNPEQYTADHPDWQPADHPQRFTGPVRTMDIFQNDFIQIRAIEFADRVTNFPHSHDYPQIIVALYGLGFVATNKEYVRLLPGDTHIEQNPRQPHQHGSAGGVFAHAVILGGEGKIISEPSAQIIGPDGQTLIG